MNWLNSNRMRLVVVGFVVAIVIGGGRAMADFVICDPRPVDEAINQGTWNVQGCSFSHDGLALYFSSARPDGYGGHDIWVARRDTQDAPWQDAVNLGANVNSSVRDVYPTISPDNLELYFWRNSTRTPHVNGAWRSTRTSTDEAWGPATPYTGIFPDDFSPDGLTMYTYEELEGGHGGLDIWVMKRATTDDEWGEPANLGANVNSSAGQLLPSISNDGRALFFTSSGIWMSVRSTTEDEWAPAVQLGPTVNGASWQGGPEISPDGSTLIFDSGPRAGFSERFWQVSIKPTVDFNGDGIVDCGDMCIMVDHWGADNKSCDIGPMPWGDGVVDVEDLKVLAEHLFEDCGLIAHWKLDETEGDVAYDSAGSHNATLYGNPIWQPTEGKIDGALQFDGIDDYANAGFVLNPKSGPFSAYAWIKGGTPGQVIISQTDGTGFGGTWLGADQADGKLFTNLMYFELASESVIADDQWHHVGIVWDGSRRSLYVDEEEVARDTSDMTAIQSTGDLYLGASKNLKATSFFTGLIDDVRIYNRAVRP